MVSFFRMLEPAVHYRHLGKRDAEYDDDEEEFFDDDYFDYDDEDDHEIVKRSPKKKPKTKSSSSRRNNHRSRQQQHDDLGHFQTPLNTRQKNKTLANDEPRKKCSAKSAR